MATLLGETGRPEAQLLRRVLDEAGFADGDSPYEVDLFERPMRHGTGRAIAVVDAEPECSLIWELLADGADDVLTWNPDDTPSAIVSRFRRWREIDRVLASPGVADIIVGESPALRSALVEVVEHAVYGNGPIVLVGETGTGKELAARLVHQVSAHARGGQLVILDCTTIVPSLSGSELFGHERGAFTGAERPRSGAFATANGGTLFLDEIGELSMGLQAELLRVLQEGTYKSVGGDTWVRTKFRLVSATNRDLQAEQAAGRFRSDLYHRIASGVVTLPPLRDRREDIEVLFAHFLAEARGGERLGIAPAVVAMLRERAFPGNLRELRHLAFAVAARHPGDGPVTPGDVPPRDRPSGSQAGMARNSLKTGIRECLLSGLTLQELKAMVGELAVDIALDRAGGSARQAAAVLGVTDRAIQLRKRANGTPVGH